MTPAVLPMPEGLSGFVILHSIDGIQSPIGDPHSDGGENAVIVENVVVYTICHVSGAKSVVFH